MRPAADLHTSHRRPLARWHGLLTGLTLTALLPGLPAQADPPGWAGLEADSGLSARLDRAEVTLEGPFATRHLWVTLHNHGPRPLEARLRIPLQADERVQGYALDVQGELREAVVVDRVQGRVAFEDTVRKNVDPALLEQDTGLAYRLRVFPVPPGGERRLRLDLAALAPRSACGWQHRLSGGGFAAQGPVPVILTARSAHAPTGLGPWKRLSDGRWQAQTQWPAAGLARAVSTCLAVPTDAGGAAQWHSERGGMPMVMAELPWRTVPGNRPLPEAVELVWDASRAMRARRFDREQALLTAYFAGRTARVHLVVLRLGMAASEDLQVQQGDVGPLLARLAQEPADGALSLGAWQPAADVGEVLLFSQGLNTWPGAGLAQPDHPVHLISSGGPADPAMAAYWARFGGQVLDLDALSPEQALRQLQARQPRWLQAAQPVVGDASQTWQGPPPSGGTLRRCRTADGSEAAVARWQDAGGQARLLRLNAKAGTATDAVAFWCGTWQAEALAAEPERYRSALSRLGQALGIVTPESSLLVLETEDDYLRHHLLPPEASPALRATVQARLAQEAVDQAAARASQLKRLREAWQTRQTWWATDFPKDAPPPLPPKLVGAAPPAPAGMAAPAPAPTAMPAPAPPVLSEARVTSASVAPGLAPGQPAASITLAALRPVEPYTQELTLAQNPATLYARYLDLRDSYAQSPAFYLDVADRLYELGDPVQAMRVLSNVVALMPRQPSALRLVAYRMQQAGQTAQALPLLERVSLLAPDEPQSLRDLGLAQAEQGQCQTAVDALGQVATTPWPSRFAEIDLIALAELNDVLSRCPTRPQLHGLPDELLAPLPVGLRAVLSWDLNDTDIDLHITDPNQEEVYYGHRNSRQGGHLSRDFTAGYGPEEFILRLPKPGRYTVAVNYFGSRLATLSRGAVVRIQLQTDFGSAERRSESLVMRLAEKSGKVLVGHFDVRADGQLQVMQP